MPGVSRFFNAWEEQAILSAILTAESDTSGEIRVHVEARCATDVAARARELFTVLGMTQTKERNGVLVYVAREDKKYGIHADEGIAKAVPADFWNEVHETLDNYFANSRYSAGIVAAIHLIGDKLKPFFPFQPGEDVNELPDDISVQDEHN